VSKVIVDSTDLSIRTTAFSGGKERGRCVQVDVMDGFGANVDYGTIQLTRPQAMFVRDALNTWLGQEGER
jgi:hypothetical protein